MRGTRWDAPRPCSSIWSRGDRAVLGSLERRIDLDLDDWHNGWLVRQLRALTSASVSNGSGASASRPSTCRAGRATRSRRIVAYRLLAVARNRAREPSRAHQRILTGDPPLPGGPARTTGQPVRGSCRRGVASSGQTPNVPVGRAASPRDAVRHGVVISAIAVTPASAIRPWLGTARRSPTVARWPALRHRGFDRRIRDSPADAAPLSRSWEWFRPHPGRPAEQADLTAAWGRAMYRVDNALNAEQVRPLLPGHGLPLSLVTTPQPCLQPGAVEAPPDFWTAHPVRARTPRGQAGPDRVAAERRAVGRSSMCARYRRPGGRSARAATHARVPPGGARDEFRAAHRPLFLGRATEQMYERCSSWRRVLTPRREAVPAFARRPCAAIPRRRPCSQVCRPRARGPRSELTQTTGHGACAGRYTSTICCAPRAALGTGRLRQDRRAALIGWSTTLHTAYAATAISRPATGFHSAAPLRTGRADTAR